jgi:glycosyltransferase involved in cell wall biosynthesis
MRINLFRFKVGQTIENSVMNRCDLVCALNKSLEKELHQRGIKNTSILPDAIDSKLYYNNDDSNFIYFTGQLWKLKGIQYLIEAFNLLSAEYDNYELLIGGNGPYEQELKKQAQNSRKRKKIKFTSWLNREQLLENYSRCTVYVLPSLAETFGIVLLEAMASSKPVIASNIVGPKDIIEHGKDGFLFQPKNIGELKKYLELILSDLALGKRMGEEGRKKVKEKYDFEATAKILEKAFESIIR